MIVVCRSAFRRFDKPLFKCRVIGFKFRGVNMEVVIPFLLVSLLAILGATKATVQSGFSKKNVNSVKDSVLFNCLAFAFIAIFLAVLFPPEFFTAETFIYGGAMGLLTASFQIFYTLALKTGPVSLSVLIVNFNVLIPTFFCIIVFKESVYLSYVVGIVLLIIALLLSYKKDDGSNTGTSFKWLLFVVIALVSAGSFGAVQKYYVEKISNENSNAFLITAYSFAFLIALVVFGAMSLKKTEEPKVKNKFWKFLAFAAIIALVLSFYQKTYMYTVDVTDGVFFNPTYLGLNSVIMSLVGIFIFKDKLTVKQKISIVLGIASVLFMNLRFWPI